MAASLSQSLATFVIPSPERTDPESVSSCLVEARSELERGAVREALKLIRRAAENSDDAGNELRAVALARAAADLATELGSTVNPPPPSVAPPTSVVTPAATVVAAPPSAAVVLPPPPPPALAPPSATVAPVVADPPVVTAPQPIVAPPAAVAAPQPAVAPPAALASPQPIVAPPAAVAAPQPAVAPPAALAAPQPAVAPPAALAAPQPAVAPPAALAAPSTLSPPASASRVSGDATLQQLFETGRAVKVIVKRSVREEGLYVVRRADGHAPALGAREAVVVLLEPDDAFFAPEKG
ncbi:MAG TPA: hypothetical protein VEQ59_10085 [Polyangiaceae bacterium]|nr:hypothetical protein [Polyangiaceae bacterium]